MIVCHRFITRTVIRSAVPIILLVLYSLPLLLRNTKVSRPRALNKSNLSENQPRFNVILPASVELSDTKTETSSSCGERCFLTMTPVGRLGNQMFQYAALLGIAHANNRSAFFPSSSIIAHYFPAVVTDDRDVSHWATVREKHYAQKDPAFDVLPTENLRISQYFQSWRYFLTISNDVKKGFVLRPEIHKKVLTLYETVIANISRDVTKIGVHVRRTDMLDPRERKRGYDSAPISYLQKAFTYMKSRFGKDSAFLVVSDDPGWCQENLKEATMRIVEPASPVVHLGFLALCDHVIMTVGTFGWWAAFLSGGHVVYFEGFPQNGSEIANGFNRKDYFLPHWVPIGK